MAAKRLEARRRLRFDDQTRQQSGWEAVTAPIYLDGSRLCIEVMKYDFRVDSIFNQGMSVIAGQIMLSAFLGLPGQNAWTCWTIQK